ncbi:PAS domain S-box protein [Methanolobus sp.]|uniref:PAS domain-containing sensor histidine kinase n=1 Tax=Methanolobus sp. TaxID=1874737 RepID=UPI00258B9D13|nr:PAS domain S-box protein [Methanolobus sp.]
MQNNKMSSKGIQDELKPDFSQLINSNNAVMLLIEPESLQIINANNAASEYYGWSCEELRQMKISQIDLFSEEEIRAEFSKAANLVKNNFTFKHQLQNHEIHDVEICAVPINTEERPLLLLTVHDITKIKESDDLLIEVGNIAKIGGWEYNVANGIGKWTPEVYRIYDLEPDSSTDSDYTLGFYLPSSRKIIEQAFDYAIKKGEPYDLELEFISAKGNHKWVRTSGRPIIENGKVVKVIGVFQDTTDHKNAELALKESEALLRDVSRLGHIGGWEVDLITDSSKWTSEMIDIFELDTNEPFDMETALKHFSTSESNKDFETAVSELIENGKPYDIEVELISDKGTHKWVRSIGKPVVEGNRVVKITGTLQDITLLKEAELALKNSEKRLQTLIDTIPDLVWLKDINGMFIDSNEKYDQFYNVSKEEIIGKTDYDFHAKELADFFRERDMKVIEAGRPLINEEMVTRVADGYTEYLETIKTPMYDSNGNIIGVLGVGRNITERKNAEAALKEKTNELQKSYERFQVAVDGSQDGIWDWDLYTNEIYFSPKWKAMIGYEDHEISNDFSIFIRMIHPDDKQKLMNHLGKYLKDEISDYNLEFRIHHKSGNYIWVLTRGAALRDENGYPYRMAGSLTDITERKKADEKIKEETLMRRILIEQSQDSIVIIDQNGKVVEANQKSADMLGYNMEEFLKLHAWDWESKLTREEILETQKNVPDKHSISFETRHRHKNGTLLDVELSANTVILGNRKLTFCVSRDISERKRAEKELLTSKIEAENANRTKSEFIANMSHELRTPLNSIIGFSQILNEKIMGDLNEKQMRYVSNIHKSGTHLLDLINDILDLSKIESGNMEYSPETIDIREVMNEIIILTEPLVKEKNINFESCRDFEKLEVNADRMKIKQIMFNLLSNAIKFAPKNGNVWFDSKLTDDNVQICVSDNGIGIPLDKQKTIFEPFKQASSSTSRTHGGTGLGLAIVKHYVEMHSGDIHVDSEVGKGSTFTFTIPIDSESC